MSDFTFSRQCVSEPLFLFVSGTLSCCLCSLREEGMGVVAHFLPTLCRQGQRSGQVCGCTTVLLGANILTHSSVSLVGAVPQQAPVLELFTELFLIRNYPLTSLYNGEAGTVWHTWSIAHCHAMAAGVVPSTHTTKLAPKGINYEVVLTTLSQIWQWQGLMR